MSLPAHHMVAAYGDPDRVALASRSPGVYDPEHDARVSALAHNMGGMKPGELPLDRAFRGQDIFGFLRRTLDLVSDSLPTVANGSAIQVLGYFGGLLVAVGSICAWRLALDWFMSTIGSMLGLRGGMGIHRGADDHSIEDYGAGYGDDWELRG